MEKQLLTQEQLDTFNKLFEVVEITVKEVFDVPDVVEFILHEMDKYIQ